MKLIEGDNFYFIDIANKKFLPPPLWDPIEVHFSISDLWPKPTDCLKGYEGQKGQKQKDMTVKKTKNGIKAQIVQHKITITRSNLKS